MTSKPIGSRGFVRLTGVLVLTGSAAWFALSSTPLAAQLPTLRIEQDVHGRKGWVLETDRIHMSSTPTRPVNRSRTINLAADVPGLSVHAFDIRMRLAARSA